MLVKYIINFSVFKNLFLIWLPENLKLYRVAHIFGLRHVSVEQPYYKAFIFVFAGQVGSTTGLSRSCLFDKVSIS